MCQTHYEKVRVIEYWNRLHHIVFYPSLIITSHSLANLIRTSVILCLISWGKFTRSKATIFSFIWKMYINVLQYGVQNKEDKFSSKQKPNLHKIPISLNLSSWVILKSPNCISHIMKLHKWLSPTIIEKTKTLLKIPLNSAPATRTSHDRHNSIAPLQLLSSPLLNPQTAK